MFFLFENETTIIELSHLECEDYLDSDDEDQNTGSGGDGLKIKVPGGA